MSVLRLHAFLPCSQANGPGRRAVFWTQGCSLGCAGCFNPQTHPIEGGRLVSVAEACGWVAHARPDLEGLTLSGGEPVQQALAVTELLEWVRRRTPLSVLLFTGYAWSELEARPEALRLLEFVDVVIAGRFHQPARLAQGLRGSANQTVHFLTPRYSAADLEAVPAGEVIIRPDGVVLLTGTDGLRPEP